MQLSELDSLDIRILQLLQENARQTNRDLAELLHKSASTINNRVSKLEENGFILKYIAVVDPDKIDLDFITFTHVRIKSHSKKSLMLFETEIIKFKEVLECHHMTGKFDFILRVATATKKDYHNFLMNKLNSIMEIRKIETTLIMKTAKSSGALPVG